MRTSPALLAAENDTRRRARRGLIIFFAVLVPLSAVFEALMISLSLSWVWALMWTPAAASAVARLALREGFADVSLRLGGRRGWSTIGLALIFPIVHRADLLRHRVDTGLVQFSPKPIKLAAMYVGEHRFPYHDVRDQPRGGCHDRNRLQRPNSCWGRDRLARLHAHAPHRRGVAQAHSNERPDLGPLARAAHSWEVCTSWARRRPWRLCSGWSRPRHLASCSRACGWRRAVFGRRSRCTQLGTPSSRPRSIRRAPALGRSVDRRVGDPRRTHDDCCSRVVLVWTVDHPQDTRRATETDAARPRLEQLAALSIAYLLSPRFGVKRLCANERVANGTPGHHIGFSTRR